jgi:hypothetical protein
VTTTTRSRAKRGKRDHDSDAAAATPLTLVNNIFSSQQDDDDVVSVDSNLATLLVPLMATTSGHLGDTQEGNDDGEIKNWLTLWDNE